MSSPATRYAVWSGSIAVASAGLLVVVSNSHGSEALRWSLLGWFVMATTGVAGGAWLAAAHGRPGSRFIVALGTCMLARLFASAAGAGLAMFAGGAGAWPYVAGLGVGFVPLQAFEMIWFLRRGRTAVPPQLHESR